MPIEIFYTKNADQQIVDFTKFFGFFCDLFGVWTFDQKNLKVEPQSWTLNLTPVYGLWEKLHSKKQLKLVSPLESGYQK